MNNQVQEYNTRTDQCYADLCGQTVSLCRTWDAGDGELIGKLSDVTPEFFVLKTGQYHDRHKLEDLEKPALVPKTAVSRIDVWKTPAEATKADTGKRKIVLEFVLDDHEDVPDVLPEIEHVRQTEHYPNGESFTRDMSAIEAGEGILTELLAFIHQQEEGTEIGDWEGWEW